MAKDPAFLFYPGDWQGGTTTFSRFLKGCYMDVLIAQFNSGPLSLEEIKTVLGSDFGSSWPTLQKKFVKDTQGLFFNEKLDNEITKRRLYSESRRKNRESKTHDPTYDKHMIRHMENDNDNDNKINGVAKNVPREPYSSADNFPSGEAAFTEVKNDELLVTSMLRIVRIEGYKACDDVTLMKAVRNFFTTESAKPTFTSRHKDDVKTHLINWVRTRAKSIHQYG